MAGILWKAKKPSMPAVPPPLALPQVGPEVEDLAMRQARQRAGFQKTLITGNLEPAPTGKKRLLGGG